MATSPPLFHLSRVWTLLRVIFLPSSLTAVELPCGTPLVFNVCSWVSTVGVDPMRPPLTGPTIHPPKRILLPVRKLSSLHAAPALGHHPSAPGSVGWFALVELSINGSTQWALFCSASAQHHVPGFLWVVVCVHSRVGLCTLLW